MIICYSFYSISFFREKSEQSRNIFCFGKKEEKLVFIQYSIFFNSLSRNGLWLGMQLMHFNAGTCVSVWKWQRHIQNFPILNRKKSFCCNWQLQQPPPWPQSTMETESERASERASQAHWIISIEWRSISIVLRKICWRCLISIAQSGINSMNK